MKVREEVEFDDVEGTFTSTSTLHYTARLKDANSSLFCSMQQTDKQGVLLYRQETRLTLDVVAPPPPVTTASSTSLSGLILGSSVGALFVLLLIFLLTFVLCRIRRQKQKEPSDVDPCPPPHNQPTVWTSNCSSNWTCQQREMTATSSFEASNSISSNSSSSFQTNRSLGDLPTLTTLHGMRPPSSPHGLHHHILSCRSSLHFPLGQDIPCFMFWMTLITVSCSRSLPEGGSGSFSTPPSRAASTLGVSLHPLSLPDPPTPPCHGSRSTLYECDHECFDDIHTVDCGNATDTTEGSVANDDDIGSLSRLVRHGLFLGSISGSSG